CRGAAGWHWLFLLSLWLRSSYYCSCRRRHYGADNSWRNSRETPDLQQAWWRSLLAKIYFDFGRHQNKNYWLNWLRQVVEACSVDEGDLSSAFPESAGDASRDSLLLSQIHWDAATRTGASRKCTSSSVASFSRAYT
ncbi:unnamed protein product, partial [Amoebophrya sp. A25]